MLTSKAALEAKVQALVDEDLLSTFWDAVDFFNTGDLILFYDTNKHEDRVTAYERHKFLASAGIPESLKIKFKEPAIQASEILKSSESAFWLLAAFNGGELATAAISANLVLKDT
jgi:hypothetical protein